LKSKYFQQNIELAQLGKKVIRKSELIKVNEMALIVGDEVLAFNRMIL